MSGQKGKTLPGGWQRAAAGLPDSVGPTIPTAPPTRAAWRLKRGRQISERRRHLGLSLRDVWALTQDYDPDGKGIAPAQLARAEKGDQDLTDMQMDWLSQALDVDRSYWSTHGQTPWYIIREQIATELLKKLDRGSIEIRRRGGEHETFIQKGHYKYVELLGKHADPDESVGKFNAFKIQAYLFEVRSEEKAKRDGAWWPKDSELPEFVFDEESAHYGEEFVRVLSGDLECWFMQPEEVERHGNHARSTAKGNDRSESKPGNWTKLFDNGGRFQYRCATCGASLEGRKLRQGDSLHYSSEIHHAFRATSKENVKALFVYSAPSLQERAIIFTREPGAGE
jgi:hypothetical protein